MPQIPIVAYADRFSVRPGEEIAFKVSVIASAPYQARLVRVISCDPSPGGPGLIEETIEAEFAGSHAARYQAVQLGSYMRVPNPTALDHLVNFTLSAVIWPTRPGAGRQSVMSRGDGEGKVGFDLSIDAEGATIETGGQRLSVGKGLVGRRWYRIWASYEAASGRLRVGQMPLTPRVDADDTGRGELQLDTAPEMSLEADFLLAAARGESGPTRHFNGKIEDPMIYSTAHEPAEMAGEIVAHWDFSQKIGTPQVVDLGPHGLAGELINLPSRAMTGSRWDGSCHGWRDNPAHYAAIHFHDDDLYDCDWETDFSFQVPDDFKSGVYAARLTDASGHEEMVPFFVPAKRGKPQARLCVLIPTFTYTVYGNIARGNTNQEMKERIAAWGAWPYGTDEHAQFARSTYNFHSDGSGVAYASRRRPIITMRAGVLSYPDVPGTGLRHFSADAHLWYWLEKMAYDFDVITDDELHREGLAAIAGYDAVTTTSHPEYHTRETLDALADYTKQGGRFLYLGGNGFYWKVAVNEHWPDAVEIRRAEGGIRAWAAEPGEYYNAFDGSYGGLWRRNGRPPQQLCGVGFTSQGAHIGDYYRRTEASRAKELAWMFDGIDGDIIGDFGLSGGGAAGFELDRADKRLGTPKNAVIVASSEGHGDHFVLVPEDVLTNLTTWNGEAMKKQIRADMVYFETGNGGAVFSVGSITFCGSLPVNDCDNNVSRLIANLLNRFLSSD